MIAAPPYAMRTGGAWLHNADPNRNSAGIARSIRVLENLSVTIARGTIGRTEMESFGGTALRKPCGHTAVGAGVSSRAGESHPVKLPHACFPLQQLFEAARLPESDLQHDE